MTLPQENAHEKKNTHDSVLDIVACQSWYQNKTRKTKLKKNKHIMQLTTCNIPQQ